MTALTREPCQKDRKNPQQLDDLSVLLVIVQQFVLGGLPEYGPPDLVVLLEGKAEPYIRKAPHTKRPVCKGSLQF